MSQRLSKYIHMAETKLPSMRRTCTSEVYSKLKAGLQQSRIVKEDILDQLEDIKDGEADEMKIEKLMQMHTKLAEYHQSVQDAFKSPGLPQHTNPFEGGGCGGASSEPCS